MDSINAFFEAGLAFMLCLNVRRIRADKKVEGFAWQVVAFTTMWGIWNLVYYPCLNQMQSFYAGIFVLAVNLIWLAHVYCYYRRSLNVKFAKKS